MKNQILPTQSVEISQDEVRFWKAEVQAALRRQRTEFINRVDPEKNIRYFEALQMAEGFDLRQLAIVDEFSPGILSVVTSTYYQNPTVTTEALNPEADRFIQPSLIYLLQNPDFIPFKSSDLLRGSLKYGMEKVGLKEEMQLCTFDLMIAGFCGLEVNHESKPKGNLNELNADPLEQTEKQNSLLSRIESGIAGIVDKVKSAFTDEEVSEKVEEELPTNQRIDFSDATYAKRWNPLDLILDSQADVFSESRYIGKRVKMTLAKFNTKYPNFKGKLSATSGSLEEVSYSSHNSKENKKVVTLYELEIKKSSGRNCILVLANGIEESVDYYEAPVISNDFAIKYECVDKYGKLYPMARATKARKPQDDINHYVTIQFEHVDRAMRKIAVYMNGLTESGKAAQTSSDPYAIVEKNSPQAVYEVMPAPSVIPDNQMVVEQMKDSLNKAIGTNNLAKSGTSNNETLGQDQLQKQAFDVNVSAVQDALQGLAEKALDRLKDIQQQLWDGEDYFKVTGLKGGDSWYDPSMGPLADILIGDYGVKINIATAARSNPIKDRDDAIQYATLITSPLMVQFAAMHGKRPTMEPLDNLAKQFNQNPEMVYEDLAPAPMMAPDGSGAPQIPQNDPALEPGMEETAPIEPTQEEMVA